MTPERKLKKAKIDVMRSTLPGLRLWSGIMAIGKTSICENTPTAYTNGRDEIYGRAFIEQLTGPQLSFVCLHEAMHKGLRHLTTWRALFEKSPTLANIACDYVVNRMIVKADPSESVVAFPRNPDGTRMGLYDTKYDGMSAAQIFKSLEDDIKEGKMSGSGEGQGFDEHGWDDAKQMTPDEQKALQKEVEHALRRGEAEAKRCGAGKGTIPAEVGQLLRPRIDWREALREFITANCTVKDDSTYRRLNRRFHALDLIMPTTYGESLGHIVVGADLSGSMWIGEPSPMRKILSEFVGIAHMCNPEHIDLLYWDNDVAGHEEYKRGDYDAIANAMRPKGGGGTDPACVQAYLKANNIKPDCIVMLTDGETFGSWGDNWPAPILWVITDNPKVEATTGKTLHVD
jgi:predicted metal-dependent peptidase